MFEDKKQIEKATEEISKHLSKEGYVFDIKDLSYDDQKVKSKCIFLSSKDTLKIKGKITITACMEEIPVEQCFNFFSDGTASCWINSEESKDYLISHTDYFIKNIDLTQPEIGISDFVNLIHELNEIVDEEDMSIMVNSDSVYINSESFNNVILNRIIEVIGTHKFTIMQSELYDPGVMIKIETPYMLEQGDIIYGKLL